MQLSGNVNRRVGQGDLTKSVRFDREEEENGLRGTDEIGWFRVELCREQNGTLPWPAPPITSDGASRAATAARFGHGNQHVEGVKLNVIFQFRRRFLRLGGGLIIELCRPDADWSRFHR